MDTKKDSLVYIRAKKRVEDEKGFYGHLTAYIIVNLFIISINFINSDTTLHDFLSWNIFVVPFFWGIGLFFHWIKTFEKNPFFSKDWEERKIKEIMNNEEEFYKKTK